MIFVYVCVCCGLLWNVLAAAACPSHARFVRFFSAFPFLAALLQEKFQRKGFSVLAFPINDFRQELPSNGEIATWVQEHFPQANFPLFSLSSLEDSPVYGQIRQQVPEQPPKWNFYKYLVDGKGHVVKVYDHRTNPLALVGDIEVLLETTTGGGGARLVTG